MLRTPVSQQQQAKSNQQNVPAPTLNDTENNFVPGSRVSIDAALSGRRSNKSRSSRISETDSQLKALLLEEQIEEDELKASIERDKILAEKRLAAHQIEQDLVLKMEERKAEFLRRKREREVKKEELKAGSSYGSSICSSRGSNSSAYTSVSQRVTQWVAETGNVDPTNPNDLRHANLEPSNHVVRQPRREPVENDLRVPEPGVNAILLEAFKALQGRNVKDLPPFSGDIMEWTIFENEFNASTEEFQLTDRDNLRRLNKALQGKARKTVESLLSSPDNVTQIMRMLKSNFGRTEWVVANRLEALRNLDVVKEGNIESFRAFYNAVVGTMVAMQNAKASNYLLNPELISHLAEKLPVFSKQMWVRHKAALMKQDIVVDFAIFARWLEDEMDNQLASLNPAFGTKKLINSAKPKPVVFHVDDRDEEAAKKCPLCSVGSHFSLDKCVCYICLKSDHARRNCKSSKKCSVCGKNHHELVHNDEPPRESPRSNQSAMPNVCNVNGRNVNTLLRVGKVKILGPNGAEEVFALFDEGSSLSMMDANVAAMIGLQGPASSVTYRWTNGISHKEEQSMMLSFDISGPSAQAKWFKASHVRSVQNLDLPPVNFDIEKVKRMYPMLDEDKLVAVHGARPCMLLGSNNAGLIVPLKTVQYSLNGLQLTRCHLGWTVHGLIEPSDAGSEDCHVLMCTEDNDVELTDLMKQAYKVEDFGITGQSPKMSDEDQRAVDIMNRTVTRRGERFEVGQIYKYGNFSFPDSKPQALRRLQMIEKKMDSDSEFAEKCCSKIQDYVDKGYARKLEPHDVEETPNTCWFKTSQKLTAYIGSRIMKIKENGHSVDLWHWVPSQLNIADLATKSSKFGSMQEWLKGPDFLPHVSTRWPIDAPVELSPAEFVNFHAELIVDTSVDSLCCTVSEDCLMDLPEIERFSDFNRLIRTTAYYLKMRKILVLPKTEKPKRLNITVHDMEDARNVWYRKVQSEVFGEEMRSLVHTGFVKSSSRLKSYSPFICNGINRMRGRVQESNKPFDVNNPVILPDNHPFSNLLIRMFHIANGHQGLETVVNNIKQRHRILKIRSQVKKYTVSCIKCRELRAKPTVPQMVPPGKHLCSGIVGVPTSHVVAMPTGCNPSQRSQQAAIQI
nr:uncharacterized protein LOC115264526 [Aedes albopictus]